MTPVPAAASPGQVIQLEHAEDQRDGRHDQHEHDEDVLLCGSGDVTVDSMRTRPGLSERHTVGLVTRYGVRTEPGFCSYLADIQGVEDDSVEEVLETQKHHL